MAACMLHLYSDTRTRANESAIVSRAASHSVSQLVDQDEDSC